MDLPPAVRSVVDAAGELTRLVPEIAAIALVGSWARRAGRSDSDVNLVVLLPRPGRLLHVDDWHQVFGPPVRLVRCRSFGAIQERRLRLFDGLEIEIGVGLPSWARTDLVEVGTRRVVAAGMAPLYDPHGLLRRLTAAGNADAPRPPPAG